MSTLPTHRTQRPRALRTIAALAAVGLAGALALGAFDTPGATPIQEKVVGALLPSQDGISPAVGDQIGAFFNDQIIGLFTVTSSTGTDFSVVVNGDNIETPAVEGPKVGQQVKFKFFDASTNQTIDMTVLNADGEVSLYIFEGAEAIDLPIVLPGLDLIPVKELDLRIGAPPSNGGGGDLGDSAKYDVNEDGKINTLDAATVLRIVTRASAEFSDNADVDGDGIVSTRDAIAVLQNR